MTLTELLIIVDIIRTANIMRLSNEYLMYNYSIVNAETIAVK